jgi:hypothetical protein
MNDYRLYLHGRDGHFVKVEVLESPADALAITEANKLRKGAPAELWQRNRKICTFEQALDQPPPGSKEG